MGEGTNFGSLKEADAVPSRASILPIQTSDLPSPTTSSFANQVHSSHFCFYFPARDVSRIYRKKGKFCRWGRVRADIFAAVCSCRVDFCFPGTAKLFIV